MFARFPHLKDATPGDEHRRNRPEWHVLLARLEAERDLRNSLGGDAGAHGIAAIMAEGSFDPRAAEMIYSLAAGARVHGDMPERRFAPDDLARLSQAITDGASRLPNPKPSECNKTNRTAAACGQRIAGDEPASSAPTPSDRNV